MRPSCGLSAPVSGFRISQRLQLCLPILAHSVLSLRSSGLEEVRITGAGFGICRVSYREAVARSADYVHIGKNLDPNVHCPKHGCDSLGRLRNLPQRSPVLARAGLGKSMPDCTLPLKTRTLPKTLRERWGVLPSA